VMWLEFRRVLFRSLVKLDVFESTPTDNSPTTWFTHTSTHGNQARLDRVYLPTKHASKWLPVVHLPQVPWSDHQPIRASFVKPVTLKPVHRFQLFPDTLKLPGVNASLRLIMAKHAHTPAGLDDAVRECSRFLRRVQAKHLRIVNSLTAKISQKLESTGSITKSQREALLRGAALREQHVRVKSYSNWDKNTRTPTQFLSYLLKCKDKSKALTGFILETGEYTNSPDEMNRFAQRRWSKVYQRKTPNPAAVAKLLAHSKIKISPQKQCTLGAPAKAAEVRAALDKLKCNAPGVSGLTKCFFVTFEKILVPLVQTWKLTRNVQS